MIPKPERPDFRKHSRIALSTEFSIPEALRRIETSRESENLSFQ
jgi:hypothetical protein